MYEDRQGIFWVGTDSGLCRYDRKGGVFTRYLPDRYNTSSLIKTGNWINTVYEDNQGRFWVGNQQGLYQMNRQTGTFTRYPYDAADTVFVNVRGEQAWYIYMDRRHTIWVATVQRGLYRFNPQTRTFKSFLYGAEVNSLLEDTNGILWVGTTAGLYRSNAAKTNFSSYTETAASDKLKGIAVRGILEDDEHAIWVNTSIGILKISRQRNEVLIHNEDFGVSTNGFSISAGFCKTRSGALLFGYNDCYYAVRPQQTTGKTLPPQIVLSQFYLGDKLVKADSNGPLTQPLNRTAAIHLHYAENTFSFGFTTIHYSNPEANQSLYKLEGLDKDWRYGGEEKIAYYYNVPPGHYTFRIRAANNEGVSSEKQLAVIISPPW